MNGTATGADGPRARAVVKRVALIAAAYVFIAAVGALSLFPYVPRTPLGWLLFLLFAPPLFCVADWIGERAARPWWESSVPGKVMKAFLFIAMGMILIVGGALLGGL